MRYDFTDHQKKEIGDIVCANFGANMQTGYSATKHTNGHLVPYVSIQHTPNGRVKFFDFWSDGTVVQRMWDTDEADVIVKTKKPNA